MSRTSKKGTSSKKRGTTSRRKGSAAKAKTPTRKKSSSRSASNRKKSSRSSASKSTQRSTRSASEGPVKKLERLIARKVDPQLKEKFERFVVKEDEVAREITRRIREALAPSMLLIKNVSDRHKGHKGAKKGQHYFLHVVSEVFSGLKSVQREQWIHSLLEDLYKNKKIHALSMKLKAATEETFDLGD